jgi:FdhD protein
MRVYLLAGGLSSRFGTDKAWAPVAGRPLAHHVAQALAPAGEIVAVVDRPGRLAGLGLPEIVDDGSHRGPMTGLAAAMAHAGTGWLAIAPCDTLGLRARWLLEMRQAAQPGDRAVAYRSERWQGLPSLWRAELLPEVERCLAKGERALWQLLEAVSARALPVPAGWAELRRIDWPEDLPDSPVARVVAERWRASMVETFDDRVAVEAPLEIRLATADGDAFTLAVTMRTPGHDDDLAVGFLHGEGVVRSAEDLRAVGPCGRSGNVVRVDLAASAVVDRGRLQRQVHATSSCGVCGKTSLEALGMAGWPSLPAGPQISPELLHGLPAVMRAAQATFERTGGLHAAALFNARGELLLLREDVGRHNAVDKVVGHALRAGPPLWPLHHAVLALSGRAGFEVVQKAVAAGIPVLAAVGAPSSLAIDTARQFGLTLVGFLRDNRFNVYAGRERLP